MKNLPSVFCCFPEQSRGRLYPEQGSPTRTCFQRDRDRIIHSTGFRRLEYKTQVFVNHEGDHYRTRLTHSLEVSQIARSIARNLNLNEDLAEALALAHDLGHTPFGHAGEEALSEVMTQFGGFDHNAQSLAVVTRLEKRYPDFEGLNLSWETLEGLAKHNGPLIGVGSNSFVSREIRTFNNLYDLELHTFPSAEAQVAAIADDIAYNNHDIDDGFRANLFSGVDMKNLPLVGEIFEAVRKQYPRIDEVLIVNEAIRRLISCMVSDCITETETRIKKTQPESVDEVRKLEYPLISFSKYMSEVDKTLKIFLFDNMYRHEKVILMTKKAHKVVKKLFEFYINDTSRLPNEWKNRILNLENHSIAQVISDYIAGMTDRYALEEYSKIIGGGEPIL